MSFHQPPTLPTQPTKTLPIIKPVPQFQFEVARRHLRMLLLVLMDGGYSPLYNSHRPLFICHDDGKPLFAPYAEDLLVPINKFINTNVDAMQPWPDHHAYLAREKARSVSSSISLLRKYCIKQVLLSDFKMLDEYHQGDQSGFWPLLKVTDSELFQGVAHDMQSALQGNPCSLMTQYCSQASNIAPCVNQHGNLHWNADHIQAMVNIVAVKHGFCMISSLRTVQIKLNPVLIFINEIVYGGHRYTIPDNRRLWNSSISIVNSFLKHTKPANTGGELALSHSLDSAMNLMDVRTTSTVTSSPTVDAEPRTDPSQRLSPQWDSDLGQSSDLFEQEELLEWSFEEEEASTTMYFHELQ